MAKARSAKNKVPVSGNGYGIAEDYLVQQVEYFQDLDCAVTVSDERFILLAWNRAAEEMFGWKAADVLGRPGQEVLRTEFSGIDQSEVWRQIGETGLYRGEAIQYRRDGTPIFVEVDICALRNEKKESAGFVTVSRDVSERGRMEQKTRRLNRQRDRQGNAQLIQKLRRETDRRDAAESALRESQTRLKRSELHLKSAQKAANLGSWVWDPAARNVEWSDEMLNIFRINREDFNNNPTIVSDRIHPDDRESYLNIIRDSLEHNMPLPHPLEFRIILPDGTIRHLVFLHPIEPGGHGVTGSIAGVVQDITERKQWERRITDAYRYNRTIIESSPVGIITCTASGRVVSANPAIARMLGASLEQILAQNVFQLDSWRDSGMLAAAEEALAAGQEKKLEARTFSSSTKQVTFDCCFVPFDHDGRRRLLALFTDITGRKRADEALHKSREELRLLAVHLQLAREEEKQHLAREFHDRLGQALTALKMDLSLLLRLVSDEKQTLSRPIIAKELKSAGMLLDDMTRSIWETIAGLRPQMLDDLGFAAAVGWETEQFTARTGIPCAFHSFSENIQLSPAVSIALFRICQEGLTNIVRHARATSVNIELSQIDNQLIFKIKDNGCGLLDGNRSKAGSFGLIGMRERVMALGGSFEIDGNPGEGTTITVCLPLDQGCSEEGAGR